jgi:hypothetical protein
MRASDKAIIEETDSLINGAFILLNSIGAFEWMSKGFVEVVCAVALIIQSETAMTVKVLSKGIKIILNKIENMKEMKKRIM